MSVARIGVGIALLVLIAGGIYISGVGRPPVFAVDARDSIESWSYPSPAFNDDGEVEAKTRGEIASRKALLGGGDEEPTDYTLYVGIANYHALLGEGKEAFNYLNKALAIDPDKTGLAWHNMGVLMARLGAINSAETAYLKATEAQPQVPLYHVARISFLMEHFAKDAVRIESAIGAALAALPENQSVNQLKEQYERSTR